MTKTRITNFILLAISLGGGVLVSNQIITQEQLTEAQGIIGLAMLGGGFSVFTIISLVKLFPQQISGFIVKQVGEDKVNKTFDTIRDLQDGFNKLVDVVTELENQLALERQARQELGVYDGVSQELKDKL